MTGTDSVNISDNVIATDEIAGRHHQSIKVAYGADGSATFASPATPMPTDDACLNLSRGLVTGIATLNKFGWNPDIDTATDPEDIWDAGGLHVPPTAARLHDIVSAVAADAAAGTGARTIRVEGLDASYAEQTEDITMNGVTPVPTVNTYTRIYRMYVLTAGSVGTNSGNITATAQTDATVTAQISGNKGQTLMAVYSVPASKTLYLTGYYGGIIRSAATGSITIQLMTRGDIDSAEPATRVRHMTGSDVRGTNYVHHQFAPYVSYTEKTDVFVRVQEVAANNSEVFGGFDGFLVDN